MSSAGSGLPGLAEGQSDARPLAGKAAPAVDGGDKAETNLPAPGSPKRLESLRSLAEQALRQQSWVEACRYQGMLLDEGEDGGPWANNSALRELGARAFFRCAESAWRFGEADRVETHLNQAEALGFHPERITHLRRSVLRERFRTHARNAAWAEAERLYQDYQAAGPPDDDERIWYGEQLATHARAAFEAGDETTLGELMRKLEDVSPLNTEFRALQDERLAPTQVLQNLVWVLGASVGAVVLLSFLSRWRARSRVGRVEAKSVFRDDDF